MEEEEEEKERTWCVQKKTAQKLLLTNTRAKFISFLLFCVLFFKFHRIKTFENMIFFFYFSFVVASFFLSH